MHELGDAGEAFAELASGMKVGEVLGAEATTFAESDGESIAESEHGGGGGGGRESEGTGFLVNGAVKGYVGGLGEGGWGMAVG
jgi:hypothetical protein